MFEEITYREIYFGEGWLRKYGSGWGWCSKMVLGPYGVGLWNNII